MSRRSDCDDEAGWLLKEMPGCSGLDSGALFPGDGPQKLAPGTDASGASAADEAIYFDFTLEVIDATTIDAILN